MVCTATAPAIVDKVDASPVGPTPSQRDIVRQCNGCRGGAECRRCWGHVVRGTHTLHGGHAEGGGACCACCQRAARSTALSHWVPRIAGTRV